MDGTELAKHIFDTGVSMNRVLARAVADGGGGLLPHIYLLEGSLSYAALGVFSTRAKAEAVQRNLDFPTTIREEVVY
jgi:hypothetical protein